MTHLSNSSLVHSKWLLISVDQRWIWLNQVVSSNHELHCNKIDGLKLDTNLSSISAILWHEQVLWINFLNYKKPRNKTHLWTIVFWESHTACISKTSTVDLKKKVEKRKRCIITTTKDYIYCPYTTCYPFQVVVKCCCPGWTISPSFIYSFFNVELVFSFWI